MGSKGLELGAVVGALDGFVLGIFVGLSVTGLRDGAWEGCALGLFVGWIGLDVGDLDGFAVGGAVGCLWNEKDMSPTIIC